MSALCARAEVLGLHARPLHEVGHAAGGKEKKGQMALTEDTP